MHLPLTLVGHDKDKYLLLVATILSFSVSVFANGAATGATATNEHVTTVVVAKISVMTNRNTITNRDFVPCV